MATTVNYTYTKINNHNDMTFTIVAGDPGAATIWPNGVPSSNQIMQFPHASPEFAAGYTIGSAYPFVF